MTLVTLKDSDPLASPLLRQMLDNLARRYGRNGFRQPQVVDAGALVLERRFVLNRWAPFDMALRRAQEGPQDRHE